MEINKNYVTAVQLLMEETTFRIGGWLWIYCI